MKKTLFAVLFAALSLCAYGQEQGPLEDLNVDFMMRGYFLAKSRITDTQVLGDFGPSANYPKAIASDMAVRDGVVSLIVQPDQERSFAGRYKGLRVLLVNNTTERLTLAAQDSRIDIVQEAQNEWGLWKPIEYLPSSWCGNSYHVVFLGPREYWEFAAPRYNGKMKTRLRFRLDWQSSQSEELTIYSNEFDGSINEKQFTVTRKYYPLSIMDPYDNFR